MSYGNFTATDLMQKFEVSFTAKKDLFAGHTTPIQPSEWLNEALKMSEDLGFSTEKSRSERLVTPIILALSKLNDSVFSVYSGYNLDVDESLGLRGECDFIFSFSHIQDFVMSPVFCITEAKKQDLEKGTVQCAAQLIAAKKLNEIEKNPVDTLYGCCTTGVEWRFLKLTDNQIVIDKKRYPISAELPELLGVLQYIIEVSKKQFPELIAAA